MGLLFSKIWATLFNLNPFKIVIVGLDGAGKTTILYKLHLGEVLSTQPTIGANFEEIKHNNVTLQAWDLGGQESLRQSWSIYYRDTAAVILVIDSCDHDRIKLAKEELFKMLKHTDLDNAALLVFANKQDLKDSLPPAEIGT